MSLYVFFNYLQIFLFVLLAIINSILIEKYFQKLYRKERDKCD